MTEYNYKWFISTPSPVINNPEALQTCLTEMGVSYLILAEFIGELTKPRKIQPNIKKLFLKHFGIKPKVTKLSSRVIQYDHEHFYFLATKLTPDETRFIDLGIKRSAKGK